MAFALDPLVQGERTARHASALAHLAAIDQRLGQAVQAGGNVRRRKDRIESGEGQGAAQQRFRLRGVPLRRGQRGQDVEREDLPRAAIHAPHARVVDREAASQERLGLRQAAVADEEETEVAQRRRQALVGRAVRAFDDIHRLAQQRLRAGAVAGGDVDGGQQAQRLRLVGRAALGGRQCARDERLRQGEVVGRTRDVQDADRGRRFLGGGVGGSRGLESRAQVRQRGRLVTTGAFAGGAIEQRARRRVRTAPAGARRAARRGASRRGSWSLSAPARLQRACRVGGDVRRTKDLARDQRVARRPRVEGRSRASPTKSGGRRGKRRHRQGP